MEESTKICMTIFLLPLAVLPLFGTTACTIGSSNTGQDINVMVLLPFTGQWAVGKTMAGAMTEICLYLNNHREILHDRNIRLIFDDTGCDVRRGLSEVVNRYIKMRQSLHAIVGGGCDIICEPVGLLAAEWNVPMISWGCPSTHLSNKDLYPTFVRTVAPYTKMAPAMEELCKSLRWSHVAIMASSQHAWQLAGVMFKVTLQKHNIAVADFHTFDPGHKNFLKSEKAMHVDILKEIARKAKILLICAYAGDTRDILLAARDLGLLGGDHVFITIDLTEDAYIGKNSWMGDDGLDAEAMDAFNGVLNIYIRKPSTPEYRQFERRVRANNALPPFNYVMAQEEQVDVHAGLLYDAILLYAHALHDTLAFNSSVINNTGITGEVYIDERGDRNPDYNIQNFQNGRFINVADYHFATGQLEMLPGVELLFPGGGSTPPIDHPPCGWSNELCPDKTYVTILAACATVVAILAAVVCIGIYLYRRMKFEAEVNSEELWRVRGDELTYAMCGSKPSSVSSSKPGLLGLSTSHLSAQDVNSDAGQVFTKRAFYKGTLVAVKMIKSTYAIVVDRKLLVQFKQVREVHHENLNTFMGACIDIPNAFALTSYCPRGSLQDVLENEDVKLNKDFKLSFLIDICKGMEYIHQSSIVSHGRLKSSNCVIDNRWVCKVTDFGLEKLRTLSNELELVGDKYEHFAGLLWTAPELLRVPAPPYCGTQKGDVYSYAIILEEVALRSGPYSMVENKEPKEIVQYVRMGLTPAYRPIIKHDECEEYMRRLMEKCWDEVPDRRPDFGRVRKILRDENKGKNLNIMDNMLKMMEQYADHLEELVNDRTVQLEEEKKKTDELLYQMLPRTVADSLKVGHYVNPEAFPSITVYFSDIVGFTNLASRSTPLQVVNFLNDLYITFDAIIDNYDVYKYFPPIYGAPPQWNTHAVETIGDAYMVASGLPVWNGDRHAGEIASLALDILKSVTHFRISHLPDVQLQLRIGLHTGPAVAGVVGVKMPRYCLFGDTVNTASRMESSGEALRIHVSEDTRNILHASGGYHITERGEVDVKGKGMMRTYWLQGKDDEKSLPDISSVLLPVENDLK